MNTYANKFTTRKQPTDYYLSLIYMQKLNKILVNKIQQGIKMLYSSINWNLFQVQGFPGSSAGKESACKEDPGSIPGFGRFPGEGIGYPLQYSWASLVKNGLPW